METIEKWFMVIEGIFIIIDLILNIYEIITSKKLEREVRKWKKLKKD